MTEGRDPTELPPLPEEMAEEGPERRKPVQRHRDPQSTLNLAMAVYIFVNLLFALPLLVFPAAFFDVIGMEKTVADELDGLRWVGAVLLAWAVSGILVLARPGGRAIFVTTGSLQLTFAGLVMLYSWSTGEYAWSLWYHVVATVITVAAAVYLWWARMRARKVLKGVEAA